MPGSSSRPTTVAEPLLQDAAPRAAAGQRQQVLAALLAGFGAALAVSYLAPGWQQLATQEPTIEMAGGLPPKVASTRFQLPVSPRPFALNNRFLPPSFPTLARRQGVTAQGVAQDTWQGRLDAALLDIDLGPQERLDLLGQALQDQKLQEDLRSAVSIIQEKGIRDGHPEFIDKLWPKGTTAREDLEGLAALRKQVPEVLQDVRSQMQGSSASTFFPDASDGAANTVSLPNASSVLGSLQTLANNPEKQKELVEEAKDLFRSTPKGLETPKYTVVRTLDGPTFLGKPEPIELRAYEEFTVARTSMKGAGFTSRSGASGFNTLASYLFGKNGAKQDMAMTMPVEMSSSTGDSQGSMAFVLPQKDAAEPPAPLESSDITIEKVPARLVAAKPFPGIVTDEEVQRQKSALLETLAAEGSLAPADDSQIIVLQYNSPLTVPWRRRNEVAMVVTEEAAQASNGAKLGNNFRKQA
jgi:hypothetical protein